MVNAKYKYKKALHKSVYEAFFMFIILFQEYLAPVPKAGQQACYS